VSAHKRLAVLFGFAAILLLGSTRPAHAQRRGGHVFVSGGLYLSPYAFYDPWYGPQWGYGFPPRYAFAPPDASVRLEVRPKEAQVFVDGYYAGIVDDFDGAFQRLHTSPGAHEIELYMDGYRTAKQQVYLPVNDTFKIKYDLEKLPMGAPNDARPQPMAPPADSNGGYAPQNGAYPPPQGGAYPPPQGYPPPQMQVRPPSSRRPPPQQMQPPQNAPDGAQQSGAFGTLSVRVQPGDAEVSIDGDQWRGPDQSDRLVVQVAEGSHTVEIRKAGYRTYVTQIDVRRGATTPVNVSLRSQEER
jgi:hypothetical protein